MRYVRGSAPIHRTRPHGRALFVKRRLRGAELPPALVPLLGVPVWDPTQAVVAAAWAAAVAFSLFAVVWYFV